ncbi:hypothetical protein WA026_003170 [Henosepilachna vigintioctopunctata]|uniref:Katanin p80 subunit C-terminal domain-containing protein n=1 Tax=Henosepilachna vigintioctopunctata TaxID=420089 RepID=A0AAW1TLH5_9CUCU
MMDSFEALSLDNSINNYRNTHPSPPTQYSRSKSNLDQIYDNNRTSKTQGERDNFLPDIHKSKLIVQKPKANLQRQMSQDEKVSPKNSFNIRQSASDANLCKNNNNMQSAKTTTRRNSFSKPRNATKIPNINSARTVPSDAKRNSLISSTPDIYASSNFSPNDSLQENDIVPGPLDKPVGLDIDDFLPKNQQVLGYRQQLPDMSEAEVLGVILRGHERMNSVIATRQRSLNLVLAQFKSKDIKAAVEMAIAMDDLAVLVDILGVFNEKYTIWNLDLCVCVLPKMQDLLQSKFESYILMGCSTLKLILRHFGPVIKNNMQSPTSSLGVDIPREERYQKSVKCHEVLLSLRPLIAKKQSAPGSVGAAVKEVNTLMQNMFD